MAPRLCVTAGESPPTDVTQRVDDAAESTGNQRFEIHCGPMDGPSPCPHPFVFGLGNPPGPQLAHFGRYASRVPKISRCPLVLEEDVPIVGANRVFGAGAPSSPAPLRGVESHRHVRSSSGVVEDGAT